MQSMNIVYVDDIIDSSLSRYLSEYCSDSKSPLIYAEVPFDYESGDTYESLLRNETIRTANVLLIDSRLFQEANAGSKFTGEEFRIILSKILPYIEVIVISQNALDVKWSVVEKCKGNRTYGELEKYYNEKLKPLINEKMSIVDETQKLIVRIETDKAIDAVLIEKIKRIAKGETEYDELSTSDIDRLVQAFQDIIAKG